MSHVQVKPAYALMAALALSPLAAQSPVTFNLPKGSLKLGLLLQGGYEAVGDATMDGTTQSFFLRRARLIFGGTLGDHFEFFVETDNPNLGKVTAPTGAKNNGGLVLQDAVLTWKALPNLKVDMGLVLAPLSHISSQGATNLLTWDYSPYAFLQNGGMGTSTGRDTGVQVRGTFLGSHLEYRVGAFQGKRVPQVNATATTAGSVVSRNALRVAGRVQYNVFDAENGQFLGGTYLGAKKLVSFGIGHDRQDDYRATSLDAIVELPLGQDGVTFQADLVNWDGKTWLTTVPKQTTLFTEAGYRFGGLKLSPMVRYETQRFDDAAKGADETRTGVGLAWWFQGHNANLKVFYTKVKKEAPKVNYKDFDQINLQVQFFAF